MIRTPSLPRMVPEFSSFKFEEGASKAFLLLANNRCSRDRQSLKAKVTCSAVSRNQVALVKSNSLESTRVGKSNKDTYCGRIDQPKTVPIGLGETRVVHKPCTSWDLDLASVVSRQSSAGLRAASRLTTSSQSPVHPQTVKGARLPAEQATIAA